MFLEDFLEDLAETHGEEFHACRTTKMDTIIMLVERGAIEVVITTVRERVSM